MEFSIRTFDTMYIDMHIYGECYQFKGGLPKQAIHSVALIIVICVVYWVRSKCPL